MPETSGSGVPRRLVLLGAGVGVGAGLLAGCGVRLEDDAPNLPGLPRRAPLPAEKALLALLSDTRGLARTAAAAPASVAPAARLALLHGEQARVLAGALRGGGVPAADVRAARPAATPTAASPARVTRADLARAEAAAPGRGGPLTARVAPEMLPTVLALLAQRATAAAELGAPVAWAGVGAGAPGVSGSSEGPAVAAAATPFVTATRAAVYGFEVAAAQASGDLRRRARSALAALKDLLADQVALAGDAAPPDPLGWSLPFPVTGDVSARRLAHRLATRLPGAYGAHLAGVASARPATTEVTRWLTAAERLSLGWGGTPAPFPGLG